MACDATLSKFRLETCNDSVGGIQAVYFVNKDTMGTITYGAELDDEEDLVTSIANSASAYKYELKDGSSFNTNVNVSLENGTTFYEQVLELMLPKLTVADHKELKLLAWGRPHVIIEDNNGNFFLAGLEHGMIVSAGTVATGANFGEMSGYTLTLTGREKLPANFLNADPATVGFTVVDA